MLGLLLAVAIFAVLLRLLTKEGLLQSLAEAGVPSLWVLVAAGALAFAISDTVIKTLAEWWREVTQSGVLGIFAVVIVVIIIFVLGVIIGKRLLSDDFGGPW